MGMHGLHTVDKSQNRNNYSHQTVDNLVDDVDRYASIHPSPLGMNMQYAKRAAETPSAACLYAENAVFVKHHPGFERKAQPLLVGAFLLAIASISFYYYKIKIHAFRE